ncbi:uncharacterized protein A1O9_01948 [Exophiala aquamarina CBS 119918]|uniref:Major facilitator superfamily (MFS) profile domain-containing protein n=1 Tax=Exophiala aquamarina CBS 119918 TaxID=1182545 RepID=A0A072PM29_9EURO|nr:uncharacterized protein A1O9_01948 [Exophiala aquamarina CBS 119918]KEF60388.1 hypothetical protein A1O9_01948 [Exophiala aquamarina CBS 119918]
MSQSRENPLQIPTVGKTGAQVPVCMETKRTASSLKDPEFPAQHEAKRTWRSYIWSTLDCPKEEARFLNKLDLTLLSAAFLGVICRYLDQVNINNAFNSGMKEDLSLYGKELNYANAIWSAAYVFGQIPSNLLLTRVNVPLYIAFLELSWTVFTFAHAGVQNVQQLYVFRFFVGIFEAGHYPAVMYVCASYYKPHELARRATIIAIATEIGPLFSGFLMAAIYSGLNGSGGLAGWRWMYIICGCISVPSAMWTALAIPQLPARAKPNWWVSSEIELARARMPTETRPFTGFYRWEDVKRWHMTWHAFLLIFWVKSYNTEGQPPVFSVAEINIIPLGINIIKIFGTAVNAWISDSLPGSLRWPGMLFVSAMAIIFPTALAATPVHPTDRGQRWVLYYLTALTGVAAGITWTWVNEVNRLNPEKRAYVGALMNAFGYIFIAWVPIFTFPANKQPYIVVGNYITAGFGVAAAAIVLIMRHLHNRDLARQKREVVPPNTAEYGDSVA